MESSCFSIVENSQGFLVDIVLVVGIVPVVDTALAFDGLDNVVVGWVL